MEFRVDVHGGSYRLAAAHTESFDDFFDIWYLGYCVQVNIQSDEMASAHICSNSEFVVNCGSYSMARNLVLRGLSRPQKI
jgi:hypothetical protein